jgi:hypothetical protein
MITCWVLKRGELAHRIYAVERISLSRRKMKRLYQSKFIMLMAWTFLEGWNTCRPFLAFAIYKRKNEYPFLYRFQIGKRFSDEYKIISVYLQRSHRTFVASFKGETGADSLEVATSASSLRTISQNALLALSFTRAFFCFRSISCTSTSTFLSDRSPYSRCLRM